MLKSSDSLGLDLKVEEQNVIVRSPLKKNNQLEKNNRNETNLLSKQKKTCGLHIQSLFCKNGVNPFDEVEWEQRKAVIKNDKGTVILRKMEWRFRNRGRLWQQMLLPQNIFSAPKKLTSMKNRFAS